MVQPTDWKMRITPMDVLGDDGQPLVVPWLSGSDDVVSMGLGLMLDEGESLTDPVVTLIQLPFFDETADVDKTTQGIVAPPTQVGSDVFVRLHNLEPERWYKIKIMHGVAGNRRGATMFIHCYE